MSKGAGRVMQGVLEALSLLGRATCSKLAAVLFDRVTVAALVSVRRAVRSLVSRGSVAILGRNLNGEHVVCLAADRARFACSWQAGAGADWWRDVFGGKHHSFMVRLFYSSKQPLGTFGS